MELLSSVADVLMPRFCMVCGRRLSIGERNVCVACTLKMPLMKYRQGEFNATEQLLVSELELVRAASYMSYYKESNYSRILYHLKYYGHPDVGFQLSRNAALQLDREHFFDGIDMIVPVPLSRRKYRKRGYNQCDYIAAGISDVTGIPVRNDIVRRNLSNSAQARKGLFQRWDNAVNLFGVSDRDALQGRHVLLVDDVITTGATLSSLIDTMSAAADIRVSVFTLAIAR